MSSRVPRHNLTHECLGRIRSYTAEHGLRLRDRLPTRQGWSRELGVSIVVVREAFVTFRALGLVDIHQGRGVFLRSLQDTDLIVLLSFTHSLDSFSQQKIIEARAMLGLATLDDIGELEQYLQRLAASNPIDSGEHSAHKLSHQAMLCVAGNRLPEGIGMPLLNTYWILGNTGAFASAIPPEQEMLEGHSLYIQAIRDCDCTRLRELVYHHLLNLCPKHRIFLFAEPSPDLLGALEQLGRALGRESISSGVDAPQVRT